MLWKDSNIDNAVNSFFENNPGNVYKNKPAFAGELCKCSFSYFRVESPLNACYLEYRLQRNAVSYSLTAHKDETKIVDRISLIPNVDDIDQTKFWQLTFINMMPFLNPSVENLFVLENGVLLLSSKYKMIINSELYYLDGQCRTQWKSYDGVLNLYDKSVITNLPKKIDKIEVAKNKGANLEQIIDGYSKPVLQFKHPDFETNQLYAAHRENLDCADQLAKEYLKSSVYF